jgi:hypothetical protein
MLRLLGLTHRLSLGRLHLLSDLLPDLCAQRGRVGRLRLCGLLHGLS